MRLSPVKHLLLLNMHHVISDAWSIRVLTDDLHALYAGHDLPPLSIQYRDYAAWHNASLAGPRAAAHRAYWLAQLAAPLPRLQLATDFRGPSGPVMPGRRSKSNCRRRTRRNSPRWPALTIRRFTRCCWRRSAC